MFKKLSEYQPCGRMGKPEEVAAAVRFLACSEASYITGSVIKIDGQIDKNLLNKLSIIDEIIDIKQLYV